MIDPFDRNETRNEDLVPMDPGAMDPAVMDPGAIALSGDDSQRIDALLERYDELLLQAEALSHRIEGLLRECNPAPSIPPTIAPSQVG